MALAHRLTGRGPAVLLLHGIPTCGRLWDLVVPRLAGRFTCVTVDLPGFGDSQPAPRGSDPEWIAGALDELRDGLGIDAWHVVGHDAGATVAVHCAAGWPRRTLGLALLAPPIFPDFRPPWFFRLVRRRGVGGLAAAAVVWRARHGGLRSLIERPGAEADAAVAAFMEPFRGLAGGRRLARLLRWGEPEEVLGRTAARLPEVAAPTLILHGRTDGAIPEEFATRAAAILPRARAVVLDSGHFLPLNLPDEVSRLLAEHLLAGAPGDAARRTTRA